MDAAMFVASCLKEAGVKRAFGLPGGEVLAVLEAFRREGIDVVLTHHETQAALMAQTAGHLTGIPGVCFSTFGPGATSMLTGVAAAFLDRAPLIAISGDYAPDRKERLTHQDLDLVAMYRPVAKHAVALHAGNVVEELPRAVRLATGELPAGQPGPVYFAAANEEMAREITSQAPRDAANMMPAAPSGDLSRAVAMLDDSRRPVLFAGLQGVQYAITDELRHLAERLNSPVLVTPQAKGVFPEDHPLYAGTFGGFGQPALDALLWDADLIVAVGLDGVDFIPPWTTTAPVLSVTGTAEPRRTFVPDLELTRVPLRLDGLTAACRGKPQIWVDLEAHRRRLAAGIHTRWEGGRFLAGDAELSPQTALAAIRKALPPDGILTADVGSHKLQAAQQWQTLRPKTFLMTNGLSPMGFAIPAAVAAKLEHPDRPVVAFMGDGGLLMFAGELETVARLGLPIAIVVLVDDSLSLIRLKQERDGLPVHGVDFGKVDYAGVARDCGLRGVRCETAAAFTAELRSALAADVATLIETPIDMRWYRPPAGQPALDVA
jgi:acetolactate synthase I/II/III large subunit